MGDRSPFGTVLGEKVDWGSLLRLPEEVRTCLSSPVGRSLSKFYILSEMVGHCA